MVESTGADMGVTLVTHTGDNKQLVGYILLLHLVQEAQPDPVFAIGVKVFDEGMR